jgi:hypothetical protein
MPTSTVVHARSFIPFFPIRFSKYPCRRPQFATGIRFSRSGKADRRQKAKCCDRHGGAHTARSRQQLRAPPQASALHANDSTTIAVEVPVWLTQHDIAALEREHGIRLVSGEAESSITGHIDLTNKPIAQLTIYALALTRLVPRAQALRHQMRVVQRERILRIFPRTLLSRPESVQRAA